ncbi:hypothetical protein [Kineococcus rubinsiae]|uniref:hypothetical protein n=1 Tax=Kineococcus rubinsiae TaxID=2609562 RepID=UPI00143174B5|nr:hypothetical protein [Kineococcus rubinsiae]NIZ91565.1 hypothetical protein [Kineococcus rubinsiae]
MAEVKRTSPSTVVTKEELDDAAHDLIELAKARGMELRRLPGRRVFTSSPNTPSIDELLRDNLRTALEDEVIAANPTADGEIDGNELDHELIKKALIGLRLSALRSVARERDLLVSGNSEQVASRIAQELGWDADAIARLVLAHEEEPTAERGHISRIFPTQETVDTALAGELLELVSGRYVRVGVARWFVFEELAFDPARLEVSGTFRSYRATVDDVRGEATLTPVPSRQSAQVVADTGAAAMEVRGPGLQAARAAAGAVQLVTGTDLRGYVPRAELAAEVGNGLHPASDFILDLVSTRFDQVGLFDRNITVARFRVAEGEPEEDSTFSRPALRAVRFEGIHLLDSIAACRLLAHERRPLVEIALQVSYKSNEDGQLVRLPVKIGVETDHVLIATGYGSDPQLSLDAHRALVNAVKAEIAEGVADDDALAILVARIGARADEIDDPETATMLTD